LFVYPEKKNGGKEKPRKCEFYMIIVYITLLFTKISTEIWSCTVWTSYYYFIDYSVFSLGNFLLILLLDLLNSTKKKIIKFHINKYHNNEQLI
jgi:hypothetical protein